MSNTIVVWSDLSRSLSSTITRQPVITRAWHTIPQKMLRNRAQSGLEHLLIRRNPVTEGKHKGDLLDHLPVGRWRGRRRRLLMLAEMSVLKALSGSLECNFDKQRGGVFFVSAGTRRPGRQRRRSFYCIRQNLDSRLARCRRWWADSGCHRSGI